MDGFIEQSPKLAFFLVILSNNVFDQQHRLLSPETSRSATIRSRNREREGLERMDKRAKSGDYSYRIYCVYILGT